MAARRAQGKSELRGVIEAARHEVSMAHEARLHGVCERHREHQVASTAIDVLGKSQSHPKVVGRMAGLGRCQEIGHEVDVVHQSRVPESRIDGIRCAPADERARTGTAEIRHLGSTGLDRASAQGSNATAERVQNLDRQLDRFKVSVRNG